MLGSTGAQAFATLDNFTRECLAIGSGRSLRGQDLVAVIDRLIAERGDRVASDNGSEFISKVLDRWAYEHGAVMDFSRPAKPTDGFRMGILFVHPTPLRPYYCAEIVNVTVFCAEAMMPAATGAWNL